MCSSDLLKVLAAIDEAVADEDRSTAEKLTRLLNAGQANKALEEIKRGVKPPAAKPVKVEVPRTLNDHANKAYSEFFEACAKVKVAGELEVLEGCLRRMQDDLRAARARLAAAP